MLDLGLDAWVTITGGADTSFSFSVAGMGDVTGDGLAEVVATTLLEELGTDVGGAYLFPSPHAPGVNGARPAGVRLVDATPGVNADVFGLPMYGTLVPLSDLNGDGLPEMALSTPWFRTWNPYGTGRIYVLASPIVAAPGGTFPLEPGYATVSSGGASLKLGYAMAGGDLDEDGIEDLVTTAPDTRDPVDGVAKGAVYVFRGPLPAGASTEANAAYRIYSDSPVPVVEGGPYFMGEQVVLGDLTGDGAADLVVTSPLTLVDGVRSVGEAYVFEGPITGDVPTSAANGTLRGSQVESDSLGVISNLLGDTDGDGYEEFSLSATGGVGAEGHVFLVDGPVTGVSTASARADSHFYGLAPDDGVSGAASAGDLDQDGLDDVALTATAVAGDTRGAVFLYYGPVPRGSFPIDSAPDATLWGATGADWPIVAVGVGDVDGDCMPDLAVGARMADTVYLLRGGTL